MAKFYITTAIDYPSGPPHMGHAYEKICADVIARWHRFQGDDVFFLTGTDEHGQKIEKCAQRVGKKPQQFADKMSKQFKQLWQKLNISNDDFIRTTEERHTRTAQVIFKKVLDKGMIYKGHYEGYYCVDCEAFYLEKDLREGRCPIHDKEVDTIKEESYFFKMSSYGKKVLEHIERNEDFILPKSRRNEVINRIKEGVRDLSVSRTTFDWGIPLPMDESHVIYVWFDALVNYISALDYPGKKFSSYWPADLHLIGKDILWFHTMIWPSILLAADIALPRRIFVHGFINVGGQKLSKSKGLTVDPVKVANTYGTDALRFFLLKEIRFGEDGNFSEDNLIRRINTDLANDLGNLLSRTVTMVENYCGGTVSPSSKGGGDLEKLCSAVFQEVESQMDNLELGQALNSIWRLVSRANGYVEETSPWAMSRDPSRKEELKGVLYNLVETLGKIAILLYPFMPEKAGEIWRQLGREGEVHHQNLVEAKEWGRFKPAVKIKKGTPLFPRVTT